MKNALLLSVFIFVAVGAFAQSQSPLTTTHFLSDFESFVDEDDIDMLKFHNITNHNSPVSFSAISIDDIIANIITTPLSNFISNNIGSNIYLSEIFGHITIDTLNKYYNVITFLGTNVSIDNLISNISIIHYDDDYYIFVNSGKISLNINNSKRYFLTGQSFVIKENGTLSLLPPQVDSNIYKNKSVSNVMSNKKSKINEIQTKMDAFSSKKSIAYYRLYIYWYFLTHY